MRKELSKVFGIPRDRLLTGPTGETLDQRQERRRVVWPNQPGSVRIVTCRINSVFRNDSRHCLFVSAFEHEHVDKIGRAPALEFPQPLRLPPFMRDTPASRVRRFVRSL